MTLRNALIAKLLIGLFAICYSGIPLAPDEAQYWTWSQHLGFGYYSKPPGIAWQIAASTSLFGNTEFGIRISALLINTATLAALYWLARGCLLSPFAATLTAVAFGFAPMGILGSLLATTDGGYILFWTLALGAYVRGAHLGWIGALIGIAALWKWTALALWPFLILHQAWSGENRWKEVGAGLLLSLLTFLPSLQWNATHDWATFRHVWGNMTGAAEHSRNGNPLEFVGAQVGLLSPILFVLMVLGLVRGLRPTSPAPIRFCAAITASTLILYTLFAFQKKIQGNWAVFLFPSGCVALAWYVEEQWEKTKGWVVAGVALSLLLSFIIGAIPALQRTNTPLLGWQPNYKLNPLRHNMGWNRLSDALTTAGYNPEHHFIFGDTYQLTSLLSHYAPGQKQAYFFNLFGRRKNQFSYWDGPDPQELGRDGYLVVAENAPHFPSDTKRWADPYLTQLAPYFEEVALIDSPVLFQSYGKAGKKGLIILCRGYKGGLPEDPEIY